MSPPEQHVDESWQAAEFFANKAAQEFRGDSRAPDAEAQALWLKELRGLATVLKEHVRMTAPQGPAWGVGGGGGSGGSAPPPPPPPPQQRKAAPPPPPPPPPPGGPGSLLKREPRAPASAAASSGGGGGGMAAVLAAIASKGDGATQGLRKVTDDMKAKNRSDRTGAVPGASAPAAAAAGASSASGAPVAAAAPPGKLAAPCPPPRLACEQGRKWVAEGFRGGRGDPKKNHDASAPIVIDGATARQSVYVFACSDVVVRVDGKVNAVSVDSCSRVTVEVAGGVVASVEAVNCDRLVLRNESGLVSTWALDKCSGVSLVLSRASLEGDAQVTTAQCSEVNIVLPEEEGRGAKSRGDGDDGGSGPTELPVPEQFVTRVVAGRLVTEPVAHSGA